MDFSHPLFLYSLVCAGFLLVYLSAVLTYAKLRKYSRNDSAGQPRTKNFQPVSSKVSKWKLVGLMFGVLSILANVALVGTITVNDAPFYGNPSLLQNVGEFK